MGSLNKQLKNDDQICNLISRCPRRCRQRQHRPTTSQSRPKLVPSSLQWKHRKRRPNLDEYGCWCYFYDNVGRGKGTPVDEIDGFCKTLGDGYQCAILDSEAAGESCIPWEVTYNPGTGAGVNPRDSCNTLNTDNCARYSCAVEGQFTDSLFAFLLSGAQINYQDYGHNFGDNPFDPIHNEGCPVKPGVKGVSGEKACCGAYPYRFPYKTLDGDRACCGARTYNTQLLNC